MIHQKLPEKVRGFDVYLHVEHERSRFEVVVEEGHDITASTIENLTEKLDGFLKRKQTEKTHKVKMAVLVHKFTDDPEDITGKKQSICYRKSSNHLKQLVDAVITGVHSGTNKALVKIGPGKTKQDSWTSGLYYEAMTDEQKAEFMRLFQIAEDAREAFNDFRDQFAIPDINRYAMGERDRIEKEAGIVK